ncbi:MAG: type II toxin-antitoxin system mRNA interferase toxin, RelE/StbE family [Nanoarchaeota archaeon]|jgi:YafQ family addiction module toxin component|nr:type II toxin-antitoxin system mRNA interferase toxin, RelE/StbE family [Nanoarchaeota archaeon]
MTYRLIIPKKLDKIFLKLSKKNKNNLRIIDNKIQKILENPYQFKPLRGNMTGIFRVHIGKSFVLTYEILEEKRTVKLIDYNHHDKVYY